MHLRVRAQHKLSPSDQHPARSISLFNWLRLTNRISSVFFCYLALHWRAWRYTWAFDVQMDDLQLETHFLNVQRVRFSLYCSQENLRETRIKKKRGKRKKWPKITDESTYMYTYCTVKTLASSVISASYNNVFVLSWELRGECELQVPLALMKWPVGNDQNKQYLASDGPTAVIFPCVLDEMTAGQWLFFIIWLFMCAEKNMFCFMFAGIHRDGWRVITGLRSLVRWSSWENKLCFDMSGIRRCLQKAYTGLWWLWPRMVQLGETRWAWITLVPCGAARGRFWTEMSHCSSLWSVAMPSKAKTLQHLCTRD